MQDLVEVGARVAGSSSLRWSCPPARLSGRPPASNGAGAWLQTPTLLFFFFSQTPTQRLVRALGIFSSNKTLEDHHRAIEARMWREGEVER